MKTHAFSRIPFASLFSVLAALWVVHSRAATIEVAPAGNDSAAGTPAAPVRSLRVALDRARATKDVTTIVVRDGRYEQDAALEISADDSRITIQAAPGARPVVSGGRRITGWKKDAAKPDLWHVSLPEVAAGGWYFHQLFVDGERVQRARTPDEGFFRTADRLGTNSPIALTFKPGDIRAEWASLPDARLVMLMKWTDLQLPIRSVDTTRNVAMLPGGPRDYWMDEKDARYWVENVPDALNAPGEWYLDRKTGELSFVAPAGVDPNKSQVVAPRIVTLLRISGSEKTRQAVSGVTLRGLTFAETDYDVPVDGVVSPQAAVPVRGAIRVEYAVDCTLVNCTLENLGGYALDLGRGAQRWHVSHCEIRGAGGGGIRIGEPGDRKPDEFTACRDHEILDSHLHRLGRIFAPACGIIVFQSGGNKILHNEINDLYYTAISVGWNWGYEETPCRGNVIAFNHLHDIGQGRLSDMGGIYTLGIQQGTILRNNLIHDVVSYDYGGWGLYPDEGSTGILLEDNVVYHCKSSGFHQHYGRENIVRNNIFAFNRENQLMRTRDEAHVSFYFTNNIVSFDSGNLLGSSWKNDRYVIDGNLYFDTRAGTDATKMKFADGTWAQWQARGHDKTSVIADPLFRNAAKRDFTLSPESPALKMGFRPIDLSTVGPRKAGN